MLDDVPYKGNGNKYSIALSLPSQDCHLEQNGTNAECSDNRRSDHKGQ
jgi:hypothetical protein